MKLSIETCIMRERYNDETAVRMIKDAGFDAYDYSMYWMSEKTDMLGDNYREKALRLKQFADEIGIECNQAHAPFDIQYTNELNMSNPDYCRIVRSVEVAAILGAENIIVHAIKNNLPANVDFEEYNRVFYGTLAPYCESFGINISVENLFNWDKENQKYVPVLSDPSEHMKFVKSLNSKYFNVCVDLGHSSVTGYKPEEVIKVMDKNLFKTLHIHDNDFVYDQHLVPYGGQMNWDKITEALALMEYSGDFTLELTGFLKNLDNDVLDAGLKYAEQTGRVLIKKIKELQH